MTYLATFNCPEHGDFSCPKCATPEPVPGGEVGALAESVVAVVWNCVHQQDLNSSAILDKRDAEAQVHQLLMTTIPALTDEQADPHPGYDCGGTCAVHKDGLWELRQAVREKGRGNG